jgi:hypothetical protein
MKIVCLFMTVLTAFAAAGYPSTGKKTLPDFDKIIDAKFVNLLGTEKKETR